MPGAVDLEKAAEFIWSNARLVERRLFANRFAGGSAEAVATALRAYQNDDGGFGQALEADLRGPDSQPIHVDMAFRILHECGAQLPEVVARACSYLESVAAPSGGVPAIFPSVDGYPRAEHWQWEHWPAESVNPTAMLVGLLRAMRCGHTWLDVAEPFCWDRLDGRHPRRRPGAGRGLLLPQPRARPPPGGDVGREAGRADPGRGVLHARSRW